MAFTVESLDLYNREDVENLIRVIKPYLAKLKEHQPAFEEKWPFWKDAEASAVGEFMRVDHDQIYRTESWKIVKEDKFVAVGYSREVILREYKATIYPVLGFFPLNWDSVDAVSALETFLQKWIKEGYKEFWVRMPFGADILGRVSVPNLGITFIESYPKPGSGAPFPPKWDIYSLEVQE